MIVSVRGTGPGHRDAACPEVRQKGLVHVPEHQFRRIGETAAGGRDPGDPAAERLRRHSTVPGAKRQDDASLQEGPCVALPGLAGGADPLAVRASISGRRPGVGPGRAGCDGNRWDGIRSDTPAQRVTTSSGPWLSQCHHAGDADGRHAGSRHDRRGARRYGRSPRHAGGRGSRDGDGCSSTWFRPFRSMIFADVGDRVLDRVQHMGIGDRIDRRLALAPPGDQQQLQPGRNGTDPGPPSRPVRPRCAPVRPEG